MQFRSGTVWVYCALTAFAILRHDDALAYDSPVGQSVSVGVVEASYTPDSVVLQVNAPVANCAAGAWLEWDGGARFPRGGDEQVRQASVKAMHASLLAALLGSRRLNIYAKNAATAGAYCRVEFVHVL
jgi:hypothetical protein